MDEALIREQEAAAAEDRTLLQAHLLYGHSAAVHVLLPVRSAPAAAVRHRGAHRQSVRPSGVAAAAPRVSGQRSFKRELRPCHRPADAGHGGYLCAGGGGAGRCAHRQGDLRRLRQLPLQPCRCGLCGGSGVLAGTGVPLSAALHGHPAVGCLGGAGIQRHRGHPAQRRHAEHRSAWRWAGRIRRPHGHRRGPGAFWPAGCSCGRRRMPTWRPP